MMTLYNKLTTLHKQMSHKYHALGKSGQNASSPGHLDKVFISWTIQEKSGLLATMSVVVVLNLNIIIGGRLQPFSPMGSAAYGNVQIGRCPVIVQLSI